MTIIPPYTWSRHVLLMCTSSRLEVRRRRRRTSLKGRSMTWRRRGPTASSRYVIDGTLHNSTFSAFALWTCRNSAISYISIKKLTSKSRTSWCHLGERSEPGHNPGNSMFHARVLTNQLFAVCSRLKDTIDTCILLSFSVFDVDFYLIVIDVHY